MQTPKPFAILRPGQSPTPLFVIHAYSLEAARALAAAMIAGETIVVGPVAAAPALSAQSPDGAGR